MDDIDREGLLPKIFHFEQRVRAAKREDGGVAVMRGNQHRGASWSMIVAQNPTAGYALLRQARHNRLRPRIVAKFREQGNIGSEPRHRHCRVDRAAARVGRDLLCFGFAAFFQQQKGRIRIQHAHALDAGAVNDRDCVDRAAAKGENFHSIHPKPCLPQGAAAAFVPHNTAGPCTSMPGTSVRRHLALHNKYGTFSLRVRCASPDALNLWEQLQF